MEGTKKRLSEERRKLKPTEACVFASALVAAKLLSQYISKQQWHRIALPAANRPLTELIRIPSTFSSSADDSFRKFLLQICL